MGEIKRSPIVAPRLVMIQLDAGIAGTKVIMIARLRNYFIVPINALLIFASLKVLVLDGFGNPKVAFAEQS